MGQYTVIANVSMGRSFDQDLNTHQTPGSAEVSVSNGIKAVRILAPRSELLLCSVLSLDISTHSPPASIAKLNGSWEIQASQLILSGSTAAIKTYPNKISVDSSG